MYIKGLDNYRVTSAKGTLESVTSDSLKYDPATITTATSPTKMSYITPNAPQESHYAYGDYILKICGDVFNDGYTCILNKKDSSALIVGFDIERLEYLPKWFPVLDKAISLLEGKDGW